MASPDRYKLGDLDRLPVDVVTRVLSELRPAELAVVEGVCISIRSLVIRHLLWRHLCTKQSEVFVSSITALVPEKDAGLADPTQSEAREEPSGTKEEHLAKIYKRYRRQHKAWKLLCYRLMAPNSSQSLLAQPLVASSTDNAEETVENVAWPLKNRRAGTVWPGVARYWSSKGHEDVDSDENLLLLLAHPACLVREVHVQAFKAEFQQGAPIYSPQRISFTAGCSDCFGSDGTPRARSEILLASSVCGSRCVTTEQQKFPKNSSLQPFVLPTPLPCFGGLLQVNLHGRTQRQAEDDKWYTCIAYLRIIGTPIYNFVPRGLAPFFNPRERVAVPRQGIQIPGLATHAYLDGANMDAQPAEGALPTSQLDNEDLDDVMESRGSSLDPDTDDYGVTSNQGMSMDTAERSPMLAVPGDPPRKCMQLHILKQDPLEARGGLHQVSECGRHVTGARHPHSAIVENLVAMHAQQQHVPDHIAQAFQAQLAAQLHNALNADEDDDDALQQAYDEYVQDAGQQ